MTAEPPRHLHAGNDVDPGRGLLDDEVVGVDGHDDPLDVDREPAGGGEQLRGAGGLGTWQSICLVDLNVDNPDGEVRLSFRAG